MRGVLAILQRVPKGDISGHGWLASFCDFLLCGYPEAAEGLCVALSKENG